METHHGKMDKPRWIGFREQVGFLLCYKGCKRVSKSGVISQITPYHRCITERLWLKCFFDRCMEIKKVENHLQIFPGLSCLVL